MGATAVLEIAAAIPPAKKSLANEIAVSLIFDVLFLLFSYLNACLKILRPVLPSIPPASGSLACSVEMADFYTGLGIFFLSEAPSREKTSASVVFPIVIGSR